MRIGIFAGTFDPIHNGHLAFASAAAKACNLDRIVYMPEAVPRGKDNTTPLAHRTAMFNVVSKRLRGFELLIFPDTQFTVAGILPQLRNIYEGDELVFLVGADVAQHLPSWPDIELMGGAELAVGEREGVPIPQNLPLKFTVVPTDYPHVSASDIRSGRSEAVTPEVRQYIIDHKLYN